MADRRRAGACGADGRLRAGRGARREPRPAPPAAATGAPAAAPPAATNAAPAAPTAAAGRQAPLRLDVGYVPSLVYAPLYTAVEKGYFRERGLELNLEPGGGSPTAQVGAGQLQLAGIGLDVAYLNSRARGIDIRFVLPGQLGERGAGEQHAARGAQGAVGRRYGPRRGRPTGTARRASSAPPWGSPTTCWRWRSTRAA